MNMYKFKLQLKRIWGFDFSDGPKTIGQAPGAPYREQP